MSKPLNPLFAVIKDGIVVDCGWKQDNKVYDARSQNIVYEEKDGYVFVEVTEKNSPFYIGTEYKE